MVSEKEIEARQDALVRRDYSGDFDAGFHDGARWARRQSKARLATLEAERDAARPFAQSMSMWPCNHAGGYNTYPLDCKCGSCNAKRWLAATQERTEDDAG